MIREILTLILNGARVQYYVEFTKERNRFVFEPGLKNKTAPAFTLTVKGEDIVSEQDVDAALLAQARKKVEEILSNDMFDKL